MKLDDPVALALALALTVLAAPVVLALDRAVQEFHARRRGDGGDR